METQYKRGFLSIHLAAAAYTCVSTLKGSGPLHLENNGKARNHVEIDKKEEKETPTSVP